MMEIKAPRLGPLVAIVGPTASGKTDLALYIAQCYSGEIICADSRTVYRGMNIGTAKPTSVEQALVPHHLLDLLEPNQPYSAAEFKAAALATISAIHARNRLPVLVGGTGLYVNAVLYDYQFPAGSSSERRRELEQLPLTELVARLRQLDPERAAEIDLRNSRRVIRAIETAGQPRIAPRALPPDVIIIGLNPGAAELDRRIATRTRKMLHDGLACEVEQLLRRFDPVIEPFRTVGYAETIAFLQGELPEEELEKQINLHTRQLARRQMTWFKRNPDIQWTTSVVTGNELADTFIAAQAKAL